MALGLVEVEVAAVVSQDPDHVSHLALFPSSRDQSQFLAGKLQTCSLVARRVLTLLTPSLKTGTFM